MRTTRRRVVLLGVSFWLMEGDRDAVRAATARGLWDVELDDTVEGLWPTSSVTTLVLLTPALGPTATMLVHRLAYTFPTRWTTADLGRHLGVPAAKVEAGLVRLVSFDVVEIDDTTIVVPARLGPLPHSLVRSLPDRLAVIHDQLVHQATTRE